VDIWGRARRSLEAADAQAQASDDDLHVVLQTLEADVASAYFNLRSLDSQSQILSSTVELYRQQVALTETKYRAGIVGRTDVVQAQAQLYTTTTLEVDARRQRADQEHALAILCGRAPSELTVPAASLEDLVPPVVPAGLPAEMLRHRPDVAEAEQNLVAANALIGVATADYYPTVNLTGLAGFETTDVRHVGWEDRVWSLAASAGLPLFTGGKLDATLEQTKARYDELLAAYRSSVLTAFREVEDALTDLHLRVDEANAQEQAVDASQEYVRLSRTEYDRGLISSLQVIDAQRTLLTNRLAAVQILNQRLTSTVLLIKALGAGWDPEFGASREASPSVGGQ
jgi:outer membrane protein, multidrug efflux system